MLSYDATDKVCDIIKIVKQETTYYLWQKYNVFLSKQYWKKKIFGQMVILPVALEKCHQRLYKNILRVKDDRQLFARLLPPPKGSGFPPMTNKWIYL